MLFLLNIYQNKDSMAAILDFTMAAKVTKLQMYPVHLLYLKTIRLDTKNILYYICVG